MARFVRSFRRKDKAADSRSRLLAWAVLSGLLFGAIEFGEPLEDALRLGRNLIRRHAASGDIVVVAIDNRSLASIGSWPWPRRAYAELLDRIGTAGPAHIFLDGELSTATNSSEDRALEDSLERLERKVTLTGWFLVDPVSNHRTDTLPLPRFRRHAGLAATNFQYNGQSIVWNLPYSLDLTGRSYPSLAAVVAGVEGRKGSSFAIDYSIDPRTIPTVSAAHVLQGKVPSRIFKGKKVIIGGTSLRISSEYSFPGYGRLPNLYVHAMGAETLKAGSPIDLGWLIPFAVAAAVAALALQQKKLRAVIGLLSACGIGLLTLPIFLDAMLVTVAVVPALFMVLVVGTVSAWTSFRHAYRIRGTVNAISGLPNLNALRHETPDVDLPLIAARIHNYAAVTSALPHGEEKTLVEQIAGRLQLGSTHTLYQGDEGIFAWFVDPSAFRSIGDHLDALHALFRSPISVGGTPVDLTITFGLDAGRDRSTANRLGSALVAADEAMAEGLKWKHYDPAKLKDAAWKLSLLSQLDAAIENRDLWVAYQPKVDLATGRIFGAEALARWTHPEKGPISPVEFILAAEQNDRIGKLTSYVMESAIAAAAAINGRGIPFDLSVNLSARLIDDPDLPRGVVALLHEYGLAPERLTLEVTETADLATGARYLDTLLQLRSFGIRISIDDYGTGLSTLDYLKKIPATEIKIDKSFIHSLGKSRSDKLLVHSTIQLAHALGQKVVAEGVEDQETLDALKEMGCDMAQGYLFGRPVPLRSLLRQVLEQKRRAAA